MKYLYLLALTSLSIGCAPRPDFYEAPRMFSTIDSELQPYFDYFTAQTGISTAGLTGGFTSLDRNVAGECVWSNSYNEVRIDAVVWFTYNYTHDEKQQLVSHELGHCAAHLQHINNCSDGTNSATAVCQAQPLSIMNWTMFNQNQISKLKLGSNEYIYYQALIRNQPVNYGSLQ